MQIGNLDQKCAIRASLVCIYTAISHPKCKKITIKDGDNQTKVPLDICKAIGHDPTKPMNYSDLYKLAVYYS